MRAKGVDHSSVLRGEDRPQIKQQPAFGDVADDWRGRGAEAGGEGVGGDIARGEGEGDRGDARARQRAAADFGFDFDDGRGERRVGERAATMPSARLRKVAGSRLSRSAGRQASNLSRVMPPVRRDA